MKLYRFLSEEDTSAFCHKVTAALNAGWALHGSPTQTWDHAAGVMRCGQAGFPSDTTTINRKHSAFRFEKDAYMRQFRQKFWRQLWHAKSALFLKVDKTFRRQTKQSFSHGARRTVVLGL